MCGRYALYGPQSRLREMFRVSYPPDWHERYNIGPGQAAPVLRSGPDGARELILANWGLLPSWVEDPAASPHPFNAKIETAASRPMFRHAWRKRRIIVPASGYYEWQETPAGKQPYFVRPRGAPFFGLAGLLEHWEGPAGSTLSFALLTCAANAAMTAIHARQPVILEPEHYTAWLDPALDDPARIARLAPPFPAAQMECYRVPRRVGNIRNDDPGLILPQPEPPED